MSGLDGNWEGNPTNTKDSPRRKLHEKQKKKKTNTCNEVDHLETWHKELGTCSGRFSVWRDILNPAHRIRLGAKPLSFPILQWPNKIVPSCIKCNCPYYWCMEFAVPNLREYCYSRRNFKHSETCKNRQRKIANEMGLEFIDNNEWNRIQPMLHSSEKARTDEQYRPLCYEERYRLSCTKSKPRLAQLSKFYISGPIVTLIVSSNI